MRPEEMLDILKRAGRLKTMTRHCYTEPDRKESVADHSWRVALMAMLLTGEGDLRGVDMDRVILMCLIHDLGEAFTGDVPTFMKSDGDEKKEEQLYLEWVETFPQAQREEWLGLLKEMIELETPEARTYKALDKLEALIAHDESDIDTWLPLEYELQLTYGKDAVSFSTYLAALREAIDRWTLEKIEKEGHGGPDNG